MSEHVTILFGLAGGLALFLYGMNSMSDALQKAAGEGMKKILSFLTKNAVMGALAGMLVTAVLQSSSATTVMVIGFVSAGLMSLPQAISVIFGANIGTTMTAQLMAFKISDYIYPIIFIGFMINFISKKENIIRIGRMKRSIYRFQSRVADRTDRQTLTIICAVKLHIFFNFIILIFKCNSVLITDNIFKILRNIECRNVAFKLRKRCGILEPVMENG